MPNIDEGANSQPFSLADLQFDINLGLGDSAQVAVITVLGDILAGQTLSIDVDGVTVSAAFNTDTDTTVTDLATAIQAEASVTTAVGAGQAITCTAAANGVPMHLKNGVVTGTGVEAIVSVEITTVSSNKGAKDEIEVIAYARAGIKRTDREWQVKKLIYDSKGLILANFFGNFEGNIPRSDYIFSLDAVPQVQELFFSRGATLLTGNTVSVDVDGTTVTQVFVTDHQATLDALAVKIAAESGVSTAVRRGDHIIEVTGAANAVPVLLNNFSVTGGSETTVIEARETKHAQAAAEFLEFSIDS